MTARDARKAD
ncbi:hypothetical protein HYQ46_013295 [Verticillium longisporum]|nr:hypothetical protein HYQ46_013295 [Verticillium longisporum]